MKDRLHNILLIASVSLLALSSCDKSLDEPKSQQGVVNPMEFGADGIAQTKVAYDGQKAQFESGDLIGLYAFYNNFYFYYTDYATFAESVIFHNQRVEVVNGSTGELTYSPVKSWAFSTLYGITPHTLDAVAYYPFITEGYDPNYVTMGYDLDGTNPRLTFKYAYTDGGEVKKINNVDLMTATKRYDYSSTPDDFRDAMLSLSHIDLLFDRQMASLNFKVTKPDLDSRKIVVKGVDVVFDADQDMTLTADAFHTIEWSNRSSGYSLHLTQDCGAEGVELGVTEYEIDTETGEIIKYETPNLLPDDKMLFFPPASDIIRVDFTVSVDGGADQIYEWHAHVAPIVRNKHYTLILELDPNREN